MFSRQYWEIYNLTSIDDIRRGKYKRIKEKTMPIKKKKKKVKKKAKKKKKIKKSKR